jgi:hypothetical protein
MTILATITQKRISWQDLSCANYGRCKLVESRSWTERKGGTACSNLAHLDTQLSPAQATKNTNKSFSRNSPVPRPKFKGGVIAQIDPQKSSLGKTQLGQLKNVFLKQKYKGNEMSSS